MAGEKVSAIIPTIQKNLVVLGKLLDILNNDKAVSEIILINNSQTEITEFGKIKKLKIHNMQKNMYVNPSWNYGVEKAENDIFLVMNDDILPIKNFATKVLESGILDKKTTGLVGINPEFINQNDRLTTNNIEAPDDDGANLSFKTMNHYRNTGDWGSAFFGRKRNYYHIPDDLKIIFGDNYILQKNLDNAKFNYLITGIPFNHIHSLSSASPEFREVVNMDIQLQSKYIR